MKEKDNIMDFSELKKSAEKKEKDQKAVFPIEDAGMERIFEELGISIDNRVLEEIFGSKDIDELVQSIQSGKFSFQEIESVMDGLKAFEEKLSHEKKTYRAFGQWISYHKPYNLSTLYPIELIRKIADKIEIPYTSMDSKNGIIEKIKPMINRYVEEFLSGLDNELLNLFGGVVYSDGKKMVETAFSEEVEVQIDFLQRHGMLSRVKDNGQKYVVIPEEILSATRSVDFDRISKYNKLNSAIVKTTIAFANTYGAFPKNILYNRIAESEKETSNLLQIDLQQYIEEYITLCFSKTSDRISLYPMIVIGDEYISHGVVEFTKYLIDIQNENLKEYRYLSEEEIHVRGRPFYYDDSVSLGQLVSMLGMVNELDHDELIQLSNLIFTFSYLEFEPSLILQILEVRYQLPRDKEYGKFLEIMRSYYKNGEKWILKGNTSYEVNNKNSSFDASKIVKVDFMNNK